MTWDQYIQNKDGNVIASYGPRYDTGENIEECDPKDADFWGVYSHDTQNGEARYVGDAYDEGSACKFAELVAKVAGLE